MMYVLPNSYASQTQDTTTRESEPESAYCYPEL